MHVEQVSDVDLIAELQLRRWARENYVAPSDRNRGWHPVILDEMQRRDVERQLSA